MARTRKARRRTKAKRNRTLPGTKEISTYLPLSFIAGMHAIQKIRHECEMSEVKLSRLYQEAVGPYIANVDWGTGLQKPPAPSNTATVSAPLLLPQLLPADRRVSDAELFHTMDQSFLMCWAAAPGGACLHVSPLLELYTGRSAPSFRGAGWTSMIHPDDRDACVRLCAERFRTCQPFAYSYRLRSVYGHYVWMADHAQPRLRPDGTFGGYVGTLYQVERCSAGEASARAFAASA